MYSKVQDSCRQQTPTVASGDHVYAVVDSTTVEPPIVSMLNCTGNQRTYLYNCMSQTQHIVLLNEI